MPKSFLERVLEEREVEKKKKRVVDWGFVWIGLTILFVSIVISNRLSSLKSNYQRNPYYQFKVNEMQQTSES